MPDGPVTELSLRLRLLTLLQDRISLVEFEDWFIDSTWDETHVSLDALELARNIELLLAEYTSGAWSGLNCAATSQTLPRRQQLRGPLSLYPVSPADRPDPSFGS